jgi:hypothetical protein
MESEMYGPSTRNNRYQLVGATGSFKTFQRNHLECKILLTIHSLKTPICFPSCMFMNIFKAAYESDLIIQYNFKEN